MREAEFRRELESQETEMNRLREELRKCQDMMGPGRVEVRVIAITDGLSST